MNANTKITSDHLKRTAIVYIRQSSPIQVAHNLERGRVMRTPSLRPLQLTAVLSPPQDNGLVQSDILAERAYYLDSEPNSPVILFQILRPDQPENAYPRCRCRLIVSGKTEENEVSGVDSIDCVALCLAVAGSRIAGLNEAVYENKLRWEGSSEDSDIGLPTIEDSPLTKHAYEEAQRWSSEEKSTAQDGPET